MILHARRHYFVRVHRAPSRVQFHYDSNFRLQPPRPATGCWSLDVTRAFRPTELHRVAAVTEGGSGGGKAPEAHPVFCAGRGRAEGMLSLVVQA
jgi:hypothetical protein